MLATAWQPNMQNGDCGDHSVSCMMMIGKRNSYLQRNWYGLDHESHAHQLSTAYYVVIIA